MMFQPEKNQLKPRKSPYLKYCFKCMLANFLPVLLSWGEKKKYSNKSAIQHIKTLILQTQADLFEIKPALD